MLPSLSKTPPQAAGQVEPLLPVNLAARALERLEHGEAARGLGLGRANDYQGQIQHPPTILQDLPKTMEK